MKKIAINTSLLALAMLCSPTASAQDEMTLTEEQTTTECCSQQEKTITIDAQVRARGEYSHGNKKPIKTSGRATGFINERARLGIGYESQLVKLKVSGQHVGVWGNQGLNSKGGTFNLNEAWGQLNTKDQKFLLRVGRQELSYDDERILGADDWSVTGNSHDVILAGFESPKHKVHVFGAFNQNRETMPSDYCATYYNDSTTHLYKMMQGLWYHYGKDKDAFQGSFLFLNVGTEIGKAWNEQTIFTRLAGVHLLYNGEKFGGSLSGYYEFGKDTLTFINTTSYTVEKITRNLSAYMGSLSVYYKPITDLKIQVGADYLSGGQTKDYLTSHSFNPLYGSYHNFYGAMDYFDRAYFTGRLGSGLLDINGSVSYKYKNILDASLGYHFLQTSYDCGTMTNSMIYLGQEIDLSLNWYPAKDCVVSAGYSHALLSKNSNYLIGYTNSHKATQNWAYISVNFSPTILIHKWGGKHSAHQSCQKSAAEPPLDGGNYHKVEPVKPVTTIKQYQ